MTRLRSIGVFLSVAAATALLSAPVALADGDHGGHDQNRGHDGDEHAVVTVVNGTPVVVNDDRADDAEDMDVAPAANQEVEQAEPEMNNVNDDND